MGKKEMKKRIEEGKRETDRNSPYPKKHGSYLLDGGIREEEMDSLIALYRECEETALNDLDLKKLRDLFIELVDIKTKYNGPSFVPAKYVASECREFNTYRDPNEGYFRHHKLEYNGK